MSLKRDHLKEEFHLPTSNHQFSVDVSVFRVGKVGISIKISWSLVVTGGILGRGKKASQAVGDKIYIKRAYNIYVHIYIYILVIYIHCLNIYIMIYPKPNIEPDNDDFQ